MERIDVGTVRWLVEAPLLLNAKSDAIAISSL